MRGHTAGQDKAMLTPHLLPARALLFFLLRSLHVPHAASVRPYTAPGCWLQLIVPYCYMLA